MNITSAQYLQDSDTNTNCAVKIVSNGETLCVPMNTDNRHYQAILEWVADGNTIQDAD